MSRFDKYVAKRENGCHEWTGYINKTGGGYGRFNRRRGKGFRICLAHRYAWERVHGTIPKDMRICHHCDNPSCVNVEHLFIATQGQNMLDAAKKGRHPMQKVTYEARKEIRKWYRNGGVSQQTIADHYGISRARVAQICLI